MRPAPSTAARSLSQKQLSRFSLEGPGCFCAAGALADEAEASTPPAIATAAKPTPMLFICVEAS